MKREYDIAVIGAGINGAAIAREAVTRGLSVIVVDKADIGSGTSAWSSRLIHGGLRYLEHGELRLVHESLHDREQLLHIAPHLVKPLAFVVPVYKHNHKPGWMFWAGMYLYDGLSLRKSVPRHRRLNRKAIKIELPSLNRDGLSAALRYYDGQVAYAERLVLDTVLSAVAAGADVLTYSEVVRVRVEAGKATGLIVRRVGATDEVTVSAKTVVNAAGPWVDEASAGLALDRMIGGTKGTHIIVDPFPGAPDVAIYYEARSDNRAVLVIPWNGRYLIGTTDDRFDGDADKVHGESEEIDYLIAETNSLIPGAQLTSESVLYTYAGIRPLPYRPAGSTGSIPRSHFILTHESIGNLVTVVGGKLTPHLSLANEVTDKIAALLGLRLSKSRADRSPLPGAVDWETASVALARELPWNETIVSRLLAVYGTRSRELLRLAGDDPKWAVTIGSGRGAIVAGEVALAITAEGAIHLADILHRRTMVGLEPSLGLDIEHPVAELAAPLLGWSKDDVEEEIRAHRAYVNERLLGGISNRHVRELESLSAE
ncbi:MAG: glycerol-3-phosphate dehydrogenase/oxidase [Nakamurella sp.]